MFKIILITAFKDNYIWLLHKDGKAIVVDPGDANPVLAVLLQQKLSLAAILITHHHQDHQGGVKTLLEHFKADVYAPKIEEIAACTHALNGDETLYLSAIDAHFQVINVKGHTRGHLAFYCAAQNVLFCGDALFSAGCGRVFEGTLLQMHRSLERLKALPNATQIYCAHEYTENNLRFAQTVNPQNLDLQKKAREVALLRAAEKPSVPFYLGEEKTTNPFLRCDVLEIKQAAQKIEPNAQSPAEVFAVLREWKNKF